jgi:hypothetical protein
MPVLIKAIQQEDAQARSPVTGQAIALRICLATSSCVSSNGMSSRTQGLCVSQG